jgi:hypothetical protein
MYQMTTLVDKKRRLPFAQKAGFAAAFLLFMSQLGAAAQVPYPVAQGAERAQSEDSPSPRSNPADVKHWFDQYDGVRRQAQMNPEERRRADEMMGHSFTQGGPEKSASQKILAQMVERYQLACQQLKKLPLLPATEQLHRGYYQYFVDAGNLFSDYIRVQDNLFAVDDRTGKLLAGELMNRKEKLESLDVRNKYLDSQLRQQYGISPYRYQL